MSIEDNEFIKSVEGWETEKHETERRGQKFRHDRWMGVGRFLKKTLIFGGIGTALFFGVPTLNNWFLEEGERQIKEGERKIAEEQAVFDAEQAEMKAHNDRLKVGREKDKREKEARITAKKKQEDELKAMQLQEANARVEAFAECLKKLGLQKCRLVEQHGMTDCWERGGADNSLACLKEKLLVRWGTMTEADAVQVEKDEKEKPVKPDDGKSD